MKKFIVVLGILALAGCASKATKWEDAGTLVSVSPWEEPVRYPGRRGAALGETQWGRSRVETTEGVYVVSSKVSVSQPGTPVRVGYIKKNSSDEYRETPSYIAFGGQQYEIAP
ncbi:MAG: hypothetical protein ACYSWO_01040 [Planctomycetota bacterium]|jgi:hypothetical protein